MNQPVPTISSATTNETPRGGSFFQRAVLQAFAAMKRGQLRLELPDGTVQIFGEPIVTQQLIAPGVYN